jgi:Autophagy-related protein 13
MPNTLDTNSTQDVAAMSKLDTVLFHFFEKIADIVLDARLPSPTSLEESDLELANELLYSLDDSWFDVTVPRAEYFAEELQLWRHLSALRDEQLQLQQQPVQLPEMVLDILLDTSESSEQDGQNTVQHLLVRTLSDGRRTLIGSNPARGGDGEIDPSPPRKPIMLERWKISLDPAHASSTTADLSETFQKLCGCAKSARHLAARLPSSVLQRRIATHKSPTGTGPQLRLGAQISAEEPSGVDARVTGMPNLNFTLPELEVDLEEFIHAQVRLAVSGKAESKGQDLSRRQHTGKRSEGSAIGVHELRSVATGLG